MIRFYTLAVGLGGFLALPLADEGFPWWLRTVEELGGYGAFLLAVGYCVRVILPKWQKDQADALARQSAIFASAILEKDKVHAEALASQRADFLRAEEALRGTILLLAERQETLGDITLAHVGQAQTKWANDDRKLSDIKNMLGVNEK
jgi:hypothetical protein